MSGTAPSCPNCGAPAPGAALLCSVCREPASAEETDDSPPSDTFDIDDVVGEGGFDSGGED